MKKIIVILILLSSVFFTGCSIETLEFQTVAKDTFSHGHPEQKNYVIENLNEWEYLWNKTNEGTYPSPKLPIIDFNSEMIIGVYMGQKSSGGYSVEIKKIAYGDVNFESVRGNGRYYYVEKTKYNETLENLGSKLM